MYVTDLRQYELPLVADISGSIGAQPYQNLVSQLQELEQSKAEAIETAARKLFEQAGGPTAPKFIHKQGMLVDQIEEIEDEYDLIVLGKRGMSAEKAIEHLGSSMERVVRASHKPCLVTPRAFKPAERLVFAYDGAESCKKALSYLQDCATLKGLEMHVVVVEEKNQDSQALANEATGRLQQHGWNVQGHVLQGGVEETIADFTGNDPATILVMGAYGHSRIRRLLLGSTTTVLLRTRNVPVLCIR